MMLRLAPVSPNKVVVVPPSWTRIPTFAAPRHLFVTRKFPNFISLCCSNVDANNSILAKPLESEINSSPTPPEFPDGFPFIIQGGEEMTREFNREEIYVRINMPMITKERVSEFKSNGGVCPPEGMVLFVNINKGNGTSVTFGVTLWPHRMEVFSLAVKSIEMRELRIDMVEKEIGKLESAIQEYLKARGIKPCYADYLYRRMVYLHMVRRSSRWCCGD